MEKNDACELMDKMIEEGHLSKDQSHNLFAISLLRSNNIDEDEKLLSNMLESGINPNGLAFNTLIKGMCFMGRFSDALSWHHVMENMGCALEIDSCSNTFTQAMQKWLCE